MLRLFSLILFTLFGFNAFAAGMTEQQKIDALLNEFDKPGITFIRNGETHDGAWAKKHLQEKYAAMKKDVVTADDFITKVASKSSQTGKPYMIQMKDGKQMESGKWLHIKLLELTRNAPKPKQ